VRGEHNRDTNELRNKGQRLFLDLRDRLQHTHGEPDQQRDDKHWPSDEQGKHDGVAGEVDDEGVGHLVLVLVTGYWLFLIADPAVVALSPATSNSTSSQQPFI
jgi:hypothetical protein